MKAILQIISEKYKNDAGNLTACAVIILIFLILVLFLIYFFRYLKHTKIKRLVKKCSALSPQQFFRIKKTSSGKRRITLYDNEFAGVYILYNTTKNMYYVGQSKHVMSRIYSHLTGHGNGDVYADYKYGDEFSIKLISLQGSGYSTLNALERDTISAYDSYANGYNKTRGNN